MCSLHCAASQIHRQSAGPSENDCQGCAAVKCPALISARIWSPNAVANALERAGGYSFNLDVRNSPFSALPIAATSGRRTSGKLHAYKEAKSLGILWASSPVGLTASAPHCHCPMWLKCTSVCWRSNCVNGALHVVGRWGSWGMPGCSLRNKPPWTMCAPNACRPWRKKFVPACTCLNSLLVRSGSPKNQSEERSGLGHRVASSGGGGVKRASEYVSHGEPTMVMATRPRA